MKEYDRDADNPVCVFEQLIPEQARLPASRR